MSVNGRGGGRVGVNGRGGGRFGLDGRGGGGRVRRPEGRGRRGGGGIGVTYLGCDRC